MTPSTQGAAAIRSSGTLGPKFGEILQRLRGTMKNENSGAVSGIQIHQDSRPRIKETVEILDASDGSIYLIPASGSYDYNLPEPSKADRELLTLMDGSHSIHYLTETLSARYKDVSPLEVMSSIQGLADAALIVEESDPTEWLPARSGQQFNRQLLYFEDMLPYHGRPGARQRRINEASVVVLGMGGVGSWIVLTLAELGVGHLTLVDGDVVSASNLNRQALCDYNDLGQPKVTTARRHLANTQPSAEVVAMPWFLTTPESVHDTLAGADLVIEAADYPVHELGHWVDAACWRLRIPHMMMSQIPPLVRVGPLFVPGKTGCLSCYEAPARAQFPFYGELVDYRRSRGSVAAATAPGCALIAGLVGSEVMHLLSEVTAPATTGVAQTIDTRTLNIVSETVVRDERCARCGEGVRQ